MAELLQEHYSGMHSDSLFDNVRGALETWNCPDQESVIEDVEISEATMMESLKNLPTRSAAGPDGIPAMLLRKCAEVVATLFRILW